MVNLKKIAEFGVFCHNRGLSTINGKNIFNHLVKEGFLDKKHRNYKGQSVTFYTVSDDFRNRTFYCEETIEDLRNYDLRNHFFVQVERSFGDGGRRPTVFLTENGASFLFDLFQDQLRKKRLVRI